MVANMGPGSYAQRADKPERTSEGHLLIVPLRVAQTFALNGGPDPRGWNVVGADGRPGGKVTDVWVDRADFMIRYLEMELTEGTGHRLVPMPMVLLDARPAEVKVSSIRSSQFAQVPVLKDADSVTVLEEEKIGAFYAGGRLYADPNRLRPLL
jgi:photosynthetic reaction center H subunit